MIFEGRKGLTYPIYKENLVRVLNANETQLLCALDAFQCYETDVKQNFLRPREQFFASLSSSDQHILSNTSFSYPNLLNNLQQSIEVNAKLARAIFHHGLEILDQQFPSRIARGHTPWSRKATEADCMIARSTIRQFYRDWSKQGITERELCHDTILKDLDRTFGHSTQSKATVRVLVPGAGLCRLAFQLDGAGYSVEANEVSHHHLLASLFILQTKSGSPTFDICPWALSFSNHVQRSHQFRQVAVPDINPNFNPSAPGAPRDRSRLTINMSDFADFYSQSEQRESFDAVVTLFFIDTAPNFIRYIETIQNCLKPGGIWINIGPLLWNCYENGPGGRQEGDLDDDEACKTRHASVPDEPGFSKLELSNDEVVAILEQFGFFVDVDEAVKGDAVYIMDPESMLQSVYRVSHWVARKQ